MAVKSTSLHHMEFSLEFGYEPKVLLEEEVLVAIEKATETSIVSENGIIYFTGINCKHARKIFRELGEMWRTYNWEEADGLVPISELVRSVHTITSVGFKEDNFSGFKAGKIFVTAKNYNQSKYIDDLGAYPFTFGIGPAGTGKTWLAVARAIQMYKQGLIKGIVIARPPVEAGKTLGFLPGDQAAKLGPYVRPMIDALDEMIGFEELEDWLTKGILEINHIGFFRGRTFKDRFVIIDESQNATEEQAKMVLTRLGDNSYMVVNGDPDQCDLPYGETSALDYLSEVFDVNQGAPDCVAITNFDESDCVRHPAVEEILQQFKVHREWREKKEKHDHENRERRLAERKEKHDLENQEPSPVEEKEVPPSPPGPRTVRDTYCP